MKKKMSNKHKMIAYVLNQDPDFDYSMKKIAGLMDVSQSTISTSIKEITYQMQINDLRKELKKAKALIPAELRKEEPIIINATYELDDNN